MTKVSLSPWSVEIGKGVTKTPRKLPQPTDTRGFENAVVVSDYRDAPLELIPHEIDGAVIPQRSKDGYVNATAMCQAAGKEANDYLRLALNQQFMEDISTEAGIPASGLVQISKGEDVSAQGMWIHPDVAVNLEQWCCPNFAVAVSKWVREWMTTGRTPIPTFDFSDPLTAARLYIEAQEGRRIAVAEVKTHPGGGHAVRGKSRAATAIRPAQC